MLHSQKNYVNGTHKSMTKCGGVQIQANLRNIS